MDISIVQEQQRPLLGRRDVTARVAFEGATPKRQELRDALAHKLHADQGLVIVRHIGTAFGSRVSTVDVSAYKDAASLEKFESAHIRKRHGDDPAAEKKGDA